MAARTGLQRRGRSRMIRLRMNRTRRATIAITFGGLLLFAIEQCLQEPEKL